MTKTEAFGYCIADIATFIKIAYEFYKAMYRGLVQKTAQGLLITTLNIKEVKRPVCLKFEGWHH